MRRAWIGGGVLAVGVLAAVLPACFSEERDPIEPPPGGVAAEVEMRPDLTFSPATVTIEAGQSVRWTNVSNFIHTATADPALASNPANVQLPAGAETFDSGSMGAGAQFSHTFTVPGTYIYFCDPHETAPMVGTVVVTE